MAQQSQPSQQWKDAKLYFIGAYAFCFLLALLWSVTSAFVYIFLGGAAVCLFLGIRSYWLSRTPNNYSSVNTNYWRRETKEETVSASSPRPPVKIKVPKVVAVVFGFMIFIVMASVFAVLSSDDDDPEFYSQLGNSYYEKGNYDSAVIYFRQSLSQDPDNIDALIGYGNTKLALIQNDLALWYFEKALVLDSENLQARYQKGRALYFNKDYEQCIPLLEAVVSDDPSKNDAIQLIGDSFYNQQKYDSALTWYEKAYSTGFRNTYLCYLMGYVYETKNNKDRAVALYKEAIQFDDTIADLFSRLGTLVPGPEGDTYRTKAASLEAEAKQ